MKETIESSQRSGRKTEVHILKYILQYIACNKVLRFELLHLWEPLETKSDCNSLVMWLLLRTQLSVPDFYLIFFFVKHTGLFSVSSTTV